MTDPKKTKLEAPEKLRYSDEELEEFKAIILAKLNKAREDLKMLMETFHLDGEHGTDDTSPTFKILEEGYQVMSKEENSRLAARQQKFINNLENALLRIENQTYGVCRATGKLISKDRLKSVPHATLSIEAKRNQHLRP
ncbi:MAG: TraR/DksA family transcriptional regulator [Bacteroidales bacterium]|nr:TraR/DksA family transcriptional regulator [Bacteroidales bacterium]